MRLVPVPAAELDEWLPRIGWHLDRFAEGGLWTPEDFIGHVRSRDRQLWVAEDGVVKAVCLTSVSDDRAKTVNITHCAGEDFHEWTHLIALIAGWAREIGSTRLELTARPGWERVMRPFGLEKTHVILEMRL